MVRFGLLASLLLVVLLIGLPGQPALAQISRPNILFLYADDLAAWALGAYGNRQAHTPHIDRLATQGALLRNSFVTTPVCSPSRAGLIASRYGTEVGITDWIDPRKEPEVGLPAGTVTWPGLLTRAGYTTGLVGKWHLGTADRYHPTRFGLAYFLGFRAGGVIPNNPELEIEGQLIKRSGLTVDIVTDEALQFIDRNRDRVFALSVHFREPHSPWLPVSDGDWAPYKDLDPVLPDPDFPNLDVPRAKKSMREYLASVTALDRAVGRLLAALEATALARKTVVVLTSDNGYNIGHNGIWHKGNGHWLLTGNQGQRPNMYDNSLRVPTIVRWPGVIRPGRQVTETISNLDWFPTILEMATVPPGRDLALRGRSFLPLLRGRRVRWENDLYAQYSQHHYVEADLRMYRTPQFKLIRDFRNAGRDELYDLARDPAERVNRIGDASLAKIRRELDKKLRARMQQLGDPIRVTPAPGVPALQSAIRNYPQFAIRKSEP